MNQEQYKHTKEYFIKYINKLLTKKRIIKKGFLKEIKLKRIYQPKDLLMKLLNTTSF